MPRYGIVGRSYNRTGSRGEIWRAGGNGHTSSAAGSAPGCWTRVLDLQRVGEVFLFIPELLHACY